MAREIARRLIDNVWTTVDVDEDVGGSTPPTAHATSSTGTLVNIGNGFEGVLDWVDTFDPDGMLDLTDTFQPAVVEAGIYAVGCSVYSFEPLTAGGTYEVALSLDVVNWGANFITVSPPGPAVSSSGGSAAFVFGGFYFEAGGVMRLSVTNRDGVAERAFGHISNIQRIT